MAVFIIGDLHLSLGCKKPMDVFQGWQDYVPRLEKSWRALVAPQDTVLLAGDTSWGMKLEETLADFRFLEALRAERCCSRATMTTGGLQSLKWLSFLRRTAFTHFLFCITRASSVRKRTSRCAARAAGWLASRMPTAVRCMQGRWGRLRASLAHAQEHYPLAERVAVLHYPPIYAGGAAREMLDAMAQYGVKRCFYGHLHAAAIRRAVQGNVEGVEYRLISADAMQFCPYKI